MEFSWKRSNSDYYAGVNLYKCIGDTVYCLYPYNTEWGPSGSSCLRDWIANSKKPFNERSTFPNWSENFIEAYRKAKFQDTLDKILK